MNYPISFNVDIDEHKIYKDIEKNAQKELIEKIKNDVEMIIFTHKAYTTSESGYNQYFTQKSCRNGLNDDVKNLIVQFLNDNKEEIINRTADNLAKRLASSKQGKAILNILEVSSND